MKIKKSTFKKFLGLCAIGAFGAGFYQEYKLSKVNNFNKVAMEESQESIISYEDLKMYHIVEMNNNDNHKLYIARPNNFNTDEEKIYYDVFTEEDIVGDNENQIVTSTPIEYYLYEIKAIKEEYSKEDLEKILNDINEIYDFTEAKLLKKSI